MDFFIAKYDENGLPKSVFFDRKRFNKEQAEHFLAKKGIQNFLFFFEPAEPTAFGDNSMVFSGEIGFDITAENVTKAISDGKEVILNSFGGSLYEGLRIHDAIQHLGTNPSIGVIGVSASAATIPLLATTNSWASENSRLLIHNPWSMVAGDDEEMRKEADALEKEKLKLAALYAKNSTKDLSEILAIMKREEFIDAAEAVELGLIKTIKTNVEPKKNDEMSEKKESDSLLTQILNKADAILAKFGTKVKNLEMTDAEGQTLTVDREEGDPAEGDAASPDGVFTFEDGTVITVTDGVIVSITTAEAPNEEMEAMKQKIAELEAELETYKQNKTTVEEMRAEVTQLVNDLRAVKSKTVIEDRQSSFKSTEKTVKGIDMSEVAAKADAAKKSIQTLKLK
jgi:ATP-dependent protease ClpP protease subunit